MDRGQRIAQIALAHVGCSSRNRVDVYEDAVRRPADAGPMFDAFYRRNKDMSSCGLAAVGFVRLAGCLEPECVAPYFPQGGPERDAVSDVQTLARRFSAWQTASPPVPTFRAGDIWVIADDRGMEAHVGVCVADAVQQPDGARVVDTVEGGQFSGSDSSAIEKFTRTWRLDGSRWMLGHRYLVGFARAADMPVPDDGAGQDGVTSDQGPEAT